VFGGLPPRLLIIISLHQPIHDDRYFLTWSINGKTTNMAVNESEISIPDELITNKIYLIRGDKVMLDRDLAELFNVKPIRLREQVKRNMEKFPSHFMFQLSEEEVEIMVSQNAIPSKQHLGGSLPYVFSELCKTSAC
jgi:hypothetical protein